MVGWLSANLKDLTAGKPVRLLAPSLTREPVLLPESGELRLVYDEATTLAHRAGSIAPRSRVVGAGGAGSCG